MRIICALMLSATLSCLFVVQTGRSLSGAGSGNCRCVDAREGPKKDERVPNAITTLFLQE